MKASWLFRSKNEARIGIRRALGGEADEHFLNRVETLAIAARVTVLPQRVRLAR